MKNKKYILKIDKISKKINDETIFENLNLNIEQGEVISITGESGIGKTTFLKCINRLTSIDSGNIYFNDKNINDYNLVQLRIKIGLVFQEYNLFENLTVFENLTLGLLKIKKINKDEAEHKADDILKYLKLEHKKSNYPFELSGGQKQRVAIARSLLMEPSILLLDEPTSSLDNETKKDIVKLIKKLKENNYTIIIVSHEDDFVSKVSDKIYILNKSGLTLKNDIKRNIHKYKIKK